MSVIFYRTALCIGPFDRACFCLSKSSKNSNFVFGAVIRVSSLYATFVEIQNQKRPDRTPFYRPRSGPYRVRHFITGLALDRLPYCGHIFLDRGPIGTPTKCLHGSQSLFSTFSEKIVWFDVFSCQVCVIYYRQLPFSLTLVCLRLKVFNLKKNTSGLSDLVQMFIHKSSTFRSKFWSLSRRG